MTGNGKNGKDRISKKIALFVAAALTAWAPVAVGAGPAIAAESYILMDAETGTVLVEKNADKPLPPASLTKIFSVYLIFSALADKRLDMEQIVSISENAWSAKVEGSKMFIEVNTDVSVRDLLYGVIVQSGNDASIALAEALSGDETAFAEEINAAGKKLGLTNSHFQNSTGLPAAQHYTSARDVALVVRRTVLDFPQWYAIYAEPDFTYNNIQQPNRNGLLAKFPGADGVKTGYTKKAGYCLAASALRDGRRMIAVVMQTKSPRARERESAKLMQYGFNHYKNIHLFSAAEERFLPLWKGEADQIAVRPAANGVYTVKRDTALRAVFAPLSPLVAPVQRGEIVGEITTLSEEGEVLHRTNVIAAAPAAAGSFWKRLKDDIHLKINAMGEIDENDNATLLSEW